MNKPVTPSTETTTPTQDIGNIKIREEEGLTSGKPEDESLADQQIDVAGGAAAPISGDSRTVTNNQPGGIVGGIPMSKFMPE